MLPRDVMIWERFLPIHGKYFDYFEYDVHVGEGVDIDPNWEPNIQASAKYLTTKRIDALGHRPGEIWIIEVKPYASLSVVGQLISYEHLYIEKFKPTDRIYKAVATDKLSSDMTGIMEKYQIRVYEVGYIEGLRE
jgi:hypothetical protein